MASASAGVGSALPDQTGNSGYGLTTDGTVASWTPVSAGGVTSLAAVGSTPSANGGSIAAQVLTLQPADATHPGLVTTGTQTFAGAKTLSSAPTAPGINGSGTSTATGFVIDTPSIGSGKIFALQKNGFEVMSLASGGDLTCYASIAAGGSGVYTALMTMSGSPSQIKMNSPNGTQFTLTVSNAGALVIT
jgi:hypothetical protein